MRAQGLREAQIVGDDGNMVNQNMAKCNSSTTICPGMRSYGTVANVAQTLSKMVWLSRLISPICLSSEHTIRFMSLLASLSLRHSNCPSINMCFTVKPLFAYTLCMLTTLFNRVESWPFAMYSPVMNFIPLDMEIKNLALFIVKISAATTTSICCSIMCGGIPSVIGRACFPGRCTVFPCKHPTSGPQMSSAAMISARLIGQLGNRLLSTK
eukprot:1190586-Ditylum_brightwellii.AAC.1